MNNACGFERIKHEMTFDEHSWKIHLFIKSVEKKHELSLWSATALQQVLGDIDEFCANLCSVYKI